MRELVPKVYPGPRKERLREFLSIRRKPRIIVVGDLMVDEYCYGTAERISPEAPVPVVLFDKESFALGGAANVAHNLVTLGARVKLAGVIGADPFGKKLCSMVKELGISTAGLFVQPGRVTTRKTRIVAHNRQMIRIDRETAEAISRDAEKRLIQFIEKESRGYDVLILSDYAKGTLTGGVLKKALESANKDGRIVLVDPKGKDFRKYKKATIIVPNLKELEAAWDRPCPTDKEMAQGARALMKITGCQALVVTRGKDGITLCQRNGTPTRWWPGEEKPVYDVTGAGDTVVSTMSYFLALGSTLEEAVYLANVAGNIVVVKQGTATVGKEEISSLLGRNLK